MAKWSMAARVFVPRVFVPLALNGQETTTTPVYFHMRLKAHQVYVPGATAEETYVPGASAEQIGG